MTGPDGIGDLKAKLIAMLSKNTSLSKEQIAKLETMSPEELAALSKGLQGKGPEFLDGFVRQDQPKVKVAEERQEKSFWQKPLGKGLKIAGGVLAVAAGAAAVVFAGPITAALAGGAAVAASSGVGLAGIGAAIAGLGLIASGCQKEPITYYDNDTIIVDVDVEIKQNYDAIVAAIQQADANAQHRFEVLLAAINQLGANVIAAIGALGDNWEVVFDKLEKILEQLQLMQQTNVEAYTNIQNQLQNLTGQQQVLFWQLMDKLDELGISISEVLTHIGNNLGDAIEQINQMLQQNNAILQQILNKINQMDENMQAGFQAVIAQILATGGNLSALLQQLNSLTEANNALLEAIFDKINQLDVNLQAGFEAVVAQILSTGGDLSAVLEELKALLQTNNNILNQHTAVLNAILAEIQGLDTNMQAGILAIINEIINSGDDVAAALEEIKALLQTNNNILNQHTEVLNQILDAIQGLDSSVQAGFASVLTQILNSTGDINAKLQALLDAINALDANVINEINNINITPGQVTVDLQPVLDAINNLNNNVSAQSAALYAMLSQISGQLDTTNDKVDAILAVANMILQNTNHMDNDLHQIRVLLRQIVDNQGNCPNNDCCDIIIEILQQILEALVTGQNDEGYHDEWGDLFG